MKDKLKTWLCPTDALLERFEAHVLDKDDKEKHRIFIDRQSDVLFVAHMDTIQQPCFTKCNEERIYAAGLDDRLGCLLAWELSEELGADLLLTDYEESGKTTAKFHDCKDYNWIVEFDRAGSDVVTYGLENEVFLDALTEFWNVGFGAYSDICDLRTEACCFNLGIGYELAHSIDSYVVLKTMQDQIDRFRQFYVRYRDTKFVRDPIEYDYYDTLWRGDNNYEDTRCDICGMPDAQALYGYYVCFDCFEAMMYKQLDIDLI